MSNIRAEIQAAAGVPVIENRPIIKELLRTAINGVYFNLRESRFYDREKGAYGAPVIRYSESAKIEGKYVNLPAPTTVAQFEARIRSDQEMIKILSETGLDLSSTSETQGSAAEAIKAIKASRKG